MSRNAIEPPLGTPHQSGLDEIRSFVATGNALPVLHEIRHALAALVERGEETVIDLGALPFSPGDERKLAEVLGEGEVAAVVTALGRSHVIETGIPGVWRVDHFDGEDRLQSSFIEITYTPEILKTQHIDAESGLERLDERLDAADAD